MCEYWYSNLGASYAKGLLHSLVLIYTPRLETTSFPGLFPWSTTPREKAWERGWGRHCDSFL